MNWHRPTRHSLIPTQDRDLVVPLGSTQLPLAPHPGAFGVKRKHHTHEGVDIYCEPGTEVCAVEAGKIVAIIPFTGTQAIPPSPWWKDTDAVLIEGPSGVVVYGEIAPINCHVGDMIERGGPIGYVIPVLQNDKGYPMFMLHLELHQPGTRNAFDWVDEKPESLLDPTPFLKNISD